jgi:hypothetical protein
MSRQKLLIEEYPDVPLEESAEHSWKSIHAFSNGVQFHSSLVVSTPWADDIWLFTAAIACVHVRAAFNRNPALSSAIIGIFAIFTVAGTRSIGRVKTIRASATVEPTKLERSAPSRRRLVCGGHKLTPPFE